MRPGTTTVSAGTLLVNGVHTGGGAYTELAEAGGIGSIASSVAVSAGGILGPAQCGHAHGRYADIDGKLQIEFDGDVDTIDKLVVTGALDVTGSTVDFDNVGVGSLSGGPHIFGSYGSLLGTFTVVDLPAGYSINYNYLGAKQIALISSAHPGDFDSDGDVDGADFVAWQQHFPTSTGATLADGDADGDGDVDGADFVVWQQNFPFTPGPGTSPVPEPGSGNPGDLRTTRLGYASRVTHRKEFEAEQAAEKSRRDTLYRRDFSALAIIMLSRKEYDDGFTNSAKWIYACGAVGGHCHYRYLDPAFALRSASWRGAARRMQCHR